MCWPSIQNDQVLIWLPGFYHNRNKEQKYGNGGAQGWEMGHLCGTRWCSVSVWASQSAYELLLIPLTVLKAF